MSQIIPISLLLKENEILPGQELHGLIEIRYPGRYDSLVINSQIEGSNDVFSYIELNGKKVKHPFARYSIFRSELGGRTSIEFTAITPHVPIGEFSSVKFRASLIQEHKEIASDIKHLKIAKTK